MNAIDPVLARTLVASLGTILNEQQTLDRVQGQLARAGQLKGTALLTHWRLLSALVRQLGSLLALARVDEHARPLSKGQLERLLGYWGALNRVRLPRWIERPTPEQLTRRLERLTPAQQDSCPAWLEQLAAPALGSAWPEVRKALSLEPPRFIRANSLKTDVNALRQELQAQRIKTRAVAGAPDALEILGYAELFRNPLFAAGLYEQQDAGSQQIAPFLEVEPGMRVVDACAGAGGKTLQLAGLLQGRGRLLALDVEAWKLAQLKKRARRAGANIETRPIEGTRTLKRLYGQIDRLLLDVPCSGTGVLRRNPESKWLYGGEQLERLLPLQADILSRYSRLLKPGGKLVYATCSILPQENRQQVTAFLAAAEGRFVLEAEQSLLPDARGWDGFYMARLRRIAD